MNSLREEKGDLGQGGGKEGREGRRGEVSKLRGVVCSPLPPRPSPRDFLFLGDGHGDERLPGRCLSDPGALQLLPFLRPGRRVERFLKQIPQATLDFGTFGGIV